MKPSSLFLTDYDAVVVGGGPAGAGTALVLARGGARVLLIDRGAYGRDCISTHALMRAGVVQLNAWGVLGAVMAAGTPAVRRTSFTYGGERLDLDIRPDCGVDAFVSPQRTVLDPILLDAAARAGVEILHGASLDGLIRTDAGRVEGATFTHEGRQIAVSCDVVVGADGRNSTVARLAGARMLKKEVHAAGYAYAYFSGMGACHNNWYFGDQVFAGTIPTNDGLHCACVAVPRQRFGATFRNDVEAGFHRIAALNSPELGDQLRAARRETRFVGFAGMPGYRRQASGPGWALVGDASYFKDPITANGISDALRDAGLLGRAILSDRMSSYGAMRDAASGELCRITDRIASFEWDIPAVQALHKRLGKILSTQATQVFEASRAMPLAA